MKKEKLKELTDLQLVDLNWNIKFILVINEKNEFLSRTELSIIKNWQKQIRDIL